MAPDDRAGPVEGLRVLEIGDRGEIAGKLLADAGADVVRVEPRAGVRSRHVGPFVADDPSGGSLLCAARNTSKRSVTLEIEGGGRDLWRRLTNGADVVIDSLDPPTLDALDAGWEASHHGQTVWCSISPFGRDGPRRDWITTDLISLALGGPMMSTGYDDHDLPPIRAEGEHSVAISNAYAVSGILAALWMRDNGGRGQLVDLSIHEAVSATTEGAFPNWEYLGRLVQRQTGRHSAPDPTAPWQLQSRDGQDILILGGGIPRDRRVWLRLLDWMDEHDATGDLRDPQYEDVLYLDPRHQHGLRRHVAERICAFASQMDAEKMYRRAQSLHLPWAIVRRPEENLDDPHWQDRDFWWEGELPGFDGLVRYPGAPYRFTKSPVRMRRRPPLLGDHNYEVYVDEIGLPTSDYRELLKSGGI